MASDGLRKFKWLAWNPLWLLIFAAWIGLIGWAMKSATTVEKPAQAQTAPAR